MATLLAVLDEADEASRRAIVAIQLQDIDANLETFGDCPDPVTVAHRYALEQQRAELLDYQTFVVGIDDEEEPDNGVVEQETPGHGIVDQEAPDDGIVDEAAPGGDLVDEEAPGNDIVDEEASGNDIVDEEASGNDIVDEEASGDDIVDEEAPGDEIVDEEASNDGVVEQEAPNNVIALRDEESDDVIIVEERVMTAQCVSCTGLHPISELLQAGCEHRYCQPCVVELVRLAMTDRTLYPPRCCRQPLPGDEVRRILPDEVLEEYTAKWEELEDQSPKYCHQPECSAYLGAADRRLDGTVGVCRSCDAQTCLLCQGVAHTGDCTEDEGLVAVQDLAIANGWQRCRTCNRLVELTIGCNHITCLCRAQFCYVCGDAWKTCACPQFDEQRLYARAERQIQREGGVVDAVQLAVRAAEIAENHVCNHRRFVRIGEGSECENCADYMPRYIWQCAGCRRRLCNRCRLNRL